MGLEQKDVHQNNGLKASQERFSYVNFWAKAPETIIDDSDIHKIKVTMFPGVIKQEIEPYLHLSLKSRRYVVIDAEEIYGKDSRKVSEMKLRAKALRFNGTFNCNYLSPEDDSKCLAEASVLMDLDIGELHERKLACSEEHAYTIMADVTDRLFRSSESTVSNEFEDWDHEHPPIFSVLHILET